MIKKIQFKPNVSVFIPYQVSGRKRHHFKRRVWTLRSHLRFLV